MKLTLYEIYKVINRRAFWCLLCGLLVLCAFLYLNNESNGTSREVIDRMEQMADEYSEMSVEEAAAAAERRAVEYQIRSARLVEDEEMRMILTEIYSESEPELYNAVMAQDEVLTEQELRTEIMANEEILGQLQYAMDYPQFLQDVQSNAQRMLNSSVFGKEGTFAYNNIKKTASDYEDAAGITVSTGIGSGVTSVTEFITGDVLVLLMVFVLCVFIYYDEYNLGLFAIVRSCRRGRGHVIWAKLITAVVLTAAMTMAYGALMLVLGYARYGYGEIDRALQSVSAFRDSTMMLTVGEYLLLAFGVKMLVFAAAAVFFSAVFTIFRNNVATVVAVSLVPMAAEWILYAKIPATFLFNHIKYINLFYYLDSTALFGDCRNLNLFTVPIGARILMLVFLAAIIAVFAAVAVRRFTTDRAAASQPLLERIVHRLSRKMRKRQKTTSLLLNEGYKFFVQEKVLVIMAALLAVSLYIVGGYNDITFDMQQSIYRKYMYTLSGEVTQEKLEFYQSIKEEYDSVSEQIQELRAQYDRGEITSSELYGSVQYLNDTVGKRSQGFALVESDMQYVEQLQQRGIDGYFVDRYTADVYFDSDSVELKNGVIVIASVILCASALYGGDIRRNMLPLLKSTKRGRGSLAGAKFMWCFAAVLTAYLAVYVPFYWFLYKNIGAMPLNAPLQSVRLYIDADCSLTIGGMFVLRHVFGLLCVCCAAAVTAALSVKLKNRIAAVIISVGLFCVPLLLQMRGIELRYFSVNNAFLLFDTFESPGALLKSMGNIVAVAAFGTAGVLLTLDTVNALPQKIFRRRMR